MQAYEKLIQNGWIVLVCLVELKCLEYYIVTLIEICGEPILNTISLKLYIAIRNNYLKLQPSIPSYNFWIYTFLAGFISKGRTQSLFEREM